ncbi:AAEL001180-PA [Aedes aegypti]|uniref:AAEL001180-PA n=1 Tax=Aedes aegypti TaxID=7159 RepID=Q17M08_AEDAE|nr:AAEL001180-PA [Aedes aegypti]
MICPASAWNGVSFLRCREHTSNGTGDSQFILLPGGKILNSCIHQLTRHVTDVPDQPQGTLQRCGASKAGTLYWRLR